MLRTHALKSIRETTKRYPVTISILLTIIALGADFAGGREIQFPLLYVIPVGIAAWQDKQKLAYTLSILLPFVRMGFENVWRIQESIPAESANAILEMIALSMYAYLLGRLAMHTVAMKTTITTQNEEMGQLRAFARMMGATLRGRGISSGLADGVAVLYMPQQESTLNDRRISSEEVEPETVRIECAVTAAINELNDLREPLEIEGAQTATALLDARLTMLKDPSLIRECRRRLAEDRITAEAAVLAQIDHLEQMLQESKRAFMRERAADVRDIGRQILRKLATSREPQPHQLASFPPGTVVVAPELLLSDALQLDFINVVAIVTEKTGPASHVAMLMRSRGIPAVCDIENATSLLASGDRVLVDAEAGTVTVAPTPAQAKRFALRKSESASFAPSVARDPLLPCVTKDGVEIGLHANISRSDEAVIALEHGLDGVGLFRSEFLFLDTDRPPDLEVQTAAYSEVATRLNPRPVVIRTMDLGGDKMPRFADADKHLALQTGLRGLAYSLTEKTMFRTQVQSIIRAAQKGNVKMMFPVVLGVADLTEARRIVDDVLQNEPSGKSPAIGAMIETPAAAFDIHGILQIVDFVSIGTNDLTQSILAMDRASQGSAGVVDFFHPSVLRATYQVVQAAVNKTVPLSVCGEAACDPVGACLLIGMGVRNLSINPFLATRVRHAIRKMTLSQMRAMTSQVLDATTKKEVQTILAAQKRDLGLQEALRTNELGQRRSEMLPTIAQTAGDTLHNRNDQEMFTKDR